MVFLKKLLKRQQNKNVSYVEDTYTEPQHTRSTAHAQRSGTEFNNSPELKQIIQFESGIALFVHTNSVSTFEQNRV